MPYQICIVIGEGEKKQVTQKNKMGSVGKGKKGNLPFFIQYCTSLGTKIDQWSVDTFGIGKVNSNMAILCEQVR